MPLDRLQVRQMVEELSARHALTKKVIEGVSERTGGVPLFVEDVTRLLHFSNVSKLTYVPRSLIVHDKPIFLKV